MSCWNVVLEVVMLRKAAQDLHGCVRLLRGGGGRGGGRSDGTDTRSKISFYPDPVKNIRKRKINLFYEHRLDICE